LCCGELRGYGVGAAGGSPPAEKEKAVQTKDGPFLSRLLPALISVFRFGRLLCEFFSYTLDSRVNVAHLWVVWKFQNHRSNP